MQVVQANLYEPPFARESFDFIYSIGVLHHTPDTRTAFARVAATVKPCGKFAVYLYARYGVSHKASDAIRTITTRLPLSG